ncbi:MAG: chemotaxis protein CheB, partial [Bacillota bacterium]|nr:chemotaxis protein CheB [Bacillota bacterium]
MRKVISDMVRQLGHEVVGTAKNGQEAVELVLALRPDVITLDIEMPVMNGLQALEMIMSKSPTPVLMLSTLTSQGAVETIKALELGAIDFMTKPTSIFKVSTPENIKELGEKLEAANAIDRNKSIRLTQSRLIQRKPSADSSLNQQPACRLPPSMKGAARNFKKIIAIGTSTGGPVALQEVISNLPAQLNASIVVVQHMPPNFTNSLAERLDSMSELTVKEATQDEILKRGTVYIAPG